MGYFFIVNLLSYNFAFVKAYFVVYHKKEIIFKVADQMVQSWVQKLLSTHVGAKTEYIALIDILCVL